MKATTQTKSSKMLVIIITMAIVAILVAVIAPKAQHAQAKAQSIIENAGTVDTMNAEALASE